MSEERYVPAFYPDFADADRWKTWDGSAYAEIWAAVQALRAEAIVTSAVMLARGGQVGDIGTVDVGGLAATLWAMRDDEVMQILHANYEEIERRLRDSD